MRVAVLSDIHANLHALEAVAKDVEDAAADEVWCLGDVVGYGGHPHEALAWVEEHADVLVKGNHDEAVATGDTTGFNPVAAAAARYHAQLLTPPERARLLDLPASLHRPIAADGSRGVDALLVHASPEDPLREYVYPTVARARLPEWAGVADLLLMGHTHVPFVARLTGTATRGFLHEGFAEASDAEGDEPRALTLVNPGSVGQPRDGDARAAWALVDFAARSVELRRVADDVDAAARAIRQAHLDPFLAARLYRGV
jgi:predicted phosphodiesterase